MRSEKCEPRKSETERSRSERLEDRRPFARCGPARIADDRSVASDGDHPDAWGENRLAAKGRPANLTPNPFPRGKGDNQIWGERVQWRTSSVRDTSIQALIRSSASSGSRRPSLTAVRISRIASSRFNFTVPPGLN